MQRFLKKTGKVAWRMFVLVAGLFLLIIGIIMIVTPGPAIVFIPAGLALLATEFHWARRILHRVRPLIDAAVEKAKKAKEAAAAKRNQKRSASTPGERVNPIRGERVDPPGGERVDPPGGERVDPPRGERVDTPHLAAANSGRTPSGAPSHAG